MGEMRNAFKGRERPVERRRRRWVDNIRMDLGEIRWEVMDCIYMVCDGNYWQALVEVGKVNLFLALK
jgi:hypothetical protein